MQVGDLISSDWKKCGSALKETPAERDAYHSGQAATALGGTRH